MADSKKLIPFILKWEGGYVNDPHDKGGETNKGITIGAWMRAGFDCSEKIPLLTVKNASGREVTYTNVTRSLYEMSEENWYRIFKKNYWDSWRADEIVSQPVANILVDWVWASGVWGIRIPQGILGVTQDGLVGPNTIAAVNSADQESLFKRIYKARCRFIEDICMKNPANERFRKGWMNRINDIIFE